MSFRVNTNVSAMNALRNVNNTSSNLNQSINRLSTGLRINSAADDPAGLIVSEQFRAQITGIDTAIKNSQDAVPRSESDFHSPSLEMRFGWLAAWYAWFARGGRKVKSSL